VKLGEYELNRIYTGDARELSKGIPDESVDLIFTDPVYENIEDYYWLAKLAKRILKPERACLAFYYQSLLPLVCQALGSYLTYSWQAIWYKTNEVKYRYAPIGKSVYVPALIYGKGEKIQRPGFSFDLRGFPVWDDAHSNHKWSKPVEWILCYIAALTRKDEIVLDPFCGGGSTLAACKVLQRNYIGFEVNAEIAEVARQRVAETQDPLPLEYQPMQERLFVAEVETQQNNRLHLTKRGAGKNLAVPERAVAAPLLASEA
jgi:DNA modification methylase